MRVKPPERYRYAPPLQLEDVEVSSAQQRAEMILSFIAEKVLDLLGALRDA